jgi:hypothetical protein
MIAELIEVLNAAAGTLPVDTRHGWAQIVAGQPAVHTGVGQWVPVANDLNGTWSYIRINGQARVEPTDIGEPCSGVRVRLPFRLVALLNRSECAELPGLLVQTAGSIRQARRQFVTASGAYQVALSNILWQIDDFVNQEFQPTPIVPSDRVLVAIDIIMEVDGREDCFEGCGELTDVVCAIIAKASNAKVIECLGPERVAQICEAPIEPCLPLSFSLSDTDGNVLLNGLQNNPCGVQLNLTAPDGTVTRDGQPFGTVLSGGTIDVPSDCPPCGPLVVKVNGEVAAEVDDPCGETVEFLVVDRESNLVEVTLNRGAIVVDALPCAPEEPCPVEVYINDTLVKTVADPCDEPSVFFEVLNEDDAQAGAFEAPNIWRVPTAKSLCDLLGDVEPGDAQTQILDCVTEATEDALREILTDRDIVATWGAYENETNAVVLPAAFQGRTYDFLSSTGTNGTITVSVNGGTSFAAPPFTVGTGGLIFRRTTITAAGTATYRE